MADKISIFRQRINSAKDILSEKKAELKLLVRRLKEEFTVESLDEVKKKLSKKEEHLPMKKKRKAKLEDKIESMLEKYEEGA